MTKNTPTGVIRQMWKRKARLNPGDPKLTKYQRFLKAREADLIAIAKVA